jgi:hypothetical protein
MVMTIIAGAWLASIASPSWAAAPSSTGLVSGVDQGLYISCPGFDVGFTATYEATFTDFHDGTGNVVRSTLQLRFTGALYNETEPARSLPYQGTANFTWTADGQRATGTYIAWISGKPVQLETGIAIIDYATGEVILHGLWQDQVLCAPLT